jgi:hypothetical protein
MEPVIFEKALVEAIERHTQIHKVMPTKIRGKYRDLVPISAFSNYTTFMGKPAYHTALNCLDIELDADADAWYLE